MGRLREALLDLDERFGVPRDARGTWEQNVRRWWWGIAIGVIWWVASSSVYILGLFVWEGRLGTGVIIGTAPLAIVLAFTSGYYYALRLRRLDRRSALPGLREPEPPNEDQPVP